MPSYAMLLPLFWYYCVKWICLFYRNYWHFGKQCLEVKRDWSDSILLLLFQFLLHLENVFKMESVRLQKLSGDRTKYFDTFYLVYKKDLLVI